MKPHILRLPLAAALLLAAAALSCASRPPETAGRESPAVYSHDSLPLDAAIEQIAAYFTGRLEPHTSLALVNFEADTRTLSDYIFEELWIYFEDNSSLVLVDRRNLELINKEIIYQMSGEVSDASAASIGRQFGPKTLVYGKVARTGGEYRLTVYATDVEHATSSMRAVNIRPGNRLAALLERPAAESDAVNMANALYAGAGNPFRFTVQTDRANGGYHDGDYMSIRIYSEQDAYFKVSHIDVNGNIQVIYPASSRDNNFIGAGRTRQIPDNTRFRMTKPYGQEIILVAAYDVPFTMGRQNAAAPLSGYAVTRGLVVENEETQTTAHPVATARVTYTIEP
ncbi:MAG: DUF4384 domain-containing protein [Spirochaetaceae bacterium]|nr:DUF4384 domain-containing protein [Spirochaetaceae bacterium]